MAEKQDEKSRLPLAGLIALVAMISGFLYYEGITLKTVRPIDKEKATTMFQKKGLVQSRLWQDPRWRRIRVEDGGLRADEGAVA